MQPDREPGRFWSSIMEWTSGFFAVPSTFIAVLMSRKRPELRDGNALGKGLPLIFRNTSDLPSSFISDELCDQDSNNEVAYSKEHLHIQIPHHSRSFQIADDWFLNGFWIHRNNVHQALACYQFAIKCFFVGVVLVSKCGPLFPLDMLEPGMSNLCNTLVSSYRSSPDADIFIRILTDNYWVAINSVSVPPLTVTVLLCLNDDSYYKNPLKIGGFNPGHLNDVLALST
jgi:hypothetical protein